MNPNIKKWMPAAIALALAGAGYFYWGPPRQRAGRRFHQRQWPHRGHRGRCGHQAAGRVQAILVDEGAFVKAGQPLARMDISSLQAQRAEAAARQAQAKTAWTPHAPRWRCARATCVPPRPRWPRAPSWTPPSGAWRVRPRWRRRAPPPARNWTTTAPAMRSQQAAGSARQGQVAAGAGRGGGGQGAGHGRESSVDAAVATVARIDAELQDAQLVAPRDGRVQFLVAQPGEVLGAGGRC